MAERFANNTASDEELLAAHVAATAVSGWVVEQAAARVSAPQADFRLDIILGYAGAAAQNRAERGVHCALIRDIFGNPFRPVTFAPEWRTATAVAIAQGMYESRDFSAMPILADALQDAGCDADNILNHCRNTSLTHVRGCWVTDLVLGKS